MKFAIIAGLIGVVLAQTNVSCDVIVAGGTLAALGAALTSAREGVQTCLLEPTDEVGGQMISVPAIDYAWQTVGTLKVGDIGKQPENLPKEFQTWRTTIGSPGKCWVSVQCFRPSIWLNLAIPAVQKEPNLRVFYNTVVKRVETAASGKRQGKLITAVVGIKRTFKGVGNGYDVRLSTDMPTWYTETETPRFTKQVLRFIGVNGKTPVVIDATELGEIMPLSGASYLQGYDKADGSIDILDETCGQAIVFPFIREVSSLAENATPLPPPDNPSSYALGSRSSGAPFTFQDEWTYRRLLQSGTAVYNTGDLSVSNWIPGILY